MATTAFAAGHDVERGRRASLGVDTTTLPVLLIDVDPAALVRGTKTPALMRVIEDHDGSLTNLAQRPVSLETPVGVELRGGDWSLRFDKKGFSLELQDGHGNDRSQSLLGMPPESDYALRSAYADHTLIRDALGYWMYESVRGRYAPRTRFVELYLGDEYWGVYWPGGRRSRC
jgi:hypothetical protein